MITIKGRTIYWYDFCHVWLARLFEKPFHEVANDNWPKE